MKEDKTRAWTNERRRTRGKQLVLRRLVARIGRTLQENGELHRGKLRKWFDSARTRRVGLPFSPLATLCRALQGWLLSDGLWSLCGLILVHVGGRVHFIVAPLHASHLLAGWLVVRYTIILILPLPLPAFVLDLSDLTATLHYTYFATLTSDINCIPSLCIFTDNISLSHRELCSCCKASSLPCRLANPAPTISTPPPWISSSRSSTPSCLTACTRTCCPSNPPSPPSIPSAPSAPA